jgi:hypothetical protein
MRSPNRFTTFPENKPAENRISANIETTNPIAVFVTPKLLAKTGIAGIINPKPTATKKETAVKTNAVFGRSPNTFLRTGKSD